MGTFSEHQKFEILILKEYGDMYIKFYEISKCFDNSSIVSGHEYMKR